MLPRYALGQRARNVLVTRIDWGKPCSQAGYVQV
jgi:hypothetical protein